MFEKKDKIKVISDMYESDLPDNLKPREHFLLSQLLALTQKLASTFYIQTIYGQLTLSQTNQFTIVMTNNGSRIINGVREKENARAIEFLKRFGAVMTTQSGPYVYMSSAVVTLDTTELDAILNALESLKDLPSPELGSSIRAMW